MTKKNLSSEIQMLIGKYTNYTNEFKSELSDNAYVRNISKF